MSSGYGKKKKKHHAPKVLIQMPDETPAAISAEGNPQDKGEKIEKHSSHVYKLPDSTVAVWGFYAAIIVAAIYALQYAAMLNSNKISRSTMVISQRAFVSFTDNLDPKSGNDKKTGKKAWGVTPHIQNSGNTAALDYRGQVNINSPDYNALPPNFDYADKVYSEGAFPNTNVKGGRGVLAPHDGTGLGLIGIPDEVLDRVNEGTAHVSIWGWVEYEDVFGCGHITKFCKEFTYRDSSGNGTLYFNNCGENNCADQTCKGYQPTKQAVCLEATPN